MSVANPDTYDVLVIGSGIIGLSTAWQLAIDGAKVCVVDRGELCKEASWAGAGMVPPGSAPTHWHSATAIEQLAGISSRLHPQWSRQLLAETGVDSEYRRCGSIRLALSCGDKESLTKEVRRWNNSGVLCTSVDRDVLKDIEPNLAALESNDAQAVLLPGEAQISSRKHLQALIVACRLRGVTLLPQTGIESFCSSESKILTAKSVDTEISAGQFCVTAGCWSGSLANALGISISLKPIRGQILLLTGPPGLLNRNIYSGNNYLAPRRDGRILVGSTMEDVGFNKGNTPEAKESLMHFATSIAPTLADLEIETCWSGLRPATADELPLMGRIPGLENAWIAAGHLRAGLQLSPATATVMSSLIRGAQPEIDVSTLGVDRLLN